MLWSSLLAVGVVGCAVGIAGAQAVGKMEARTSLGYFASYANDSSAILIGSAQDQKLLLAGADWNVRQGHRQSVRFQYQFEVVPLAMLRGPYARFTSDATYLPGAPQDPNFPPGVHTIEGLLYQKCYASSYSGPITPPAGQQPVGTVTYGYTCSHAYTYGGGLSPLGEKVTFLADHAVHPYAIVNFGFLAFTRFVPDTNAARFNFTAQSGAGFEWGRRGQGSWAIDARYHHTSNGGRAFFNPGIDQVMYRVSYTLSHGLLGRS